MLYGEELFFFEASAEGGSPINMNAGVAAVYTRPINRPILVRSFGYRVTTGFNYNVVNKQGVVSLYQYPKGSSANKVLLASMNLQDALAANFVALCKVANIPPDTNPAGVGPALIYVGDELVIEVSVQATGGTYIAGAFQPFIGYHNRGYSEGNEPLLVDLTPAIVGV